MCFPIQITCCQDEYKKGWKKIKNKDCIDDQSKLNSITHLTIWKSWNSCTYVECRLQVAKLLFFEQDEKKLNFI